MHQPLRVMRMTIKHIASLESNLMVNELVSKENNKGAATLVNLKVLMLNKDIHTITEFFQKIRGVKKLIFIYNEKNETFYNYRTCSPF